VHAPGAVWVLIALGLVLVAFVVYSQIQDSRAQRRAAALHVEAVEFEGKKNLQAAYRRYSWLCDVATFRPSGGGESSCESAARLNSTISAAYDETVAALKRYRKAKGRYPDSLDEVKEQVPPSLVPVLSGFKYIREGDTKASILTGIEVSVVFSLK